MSKDKFVTGNLHKISDKIAEVAKKHEQELSQWKNPPPKSAGSSFTAGEEKSVTEQENTGTLPSSLPAVEEQKEEVDMNVLAVTHTVQEGGEKRKRLSDSMEAALQRHHEEGLRLKRDLQMLLESTWAEVGENGEKLEQDLAEIRKLQNALTDSRRDFSLLTFPDQDDPQYQMLLASIYRKMDKIKIELLHLKAKAQRHSFQPPSAGEKQLNQSGINLFAEMHSLKKSTLFQTGFWMHLPLILGILFAALILAAAQILTFRVGL